ncbi:SusC/RagA family TonB-linked outer membrane protein [Draconibacterium mangrovi]|uniref:SusC/RagA family TonB-linked outer membrane protein n=1 Tax=Draconibacterium mangrovi TaxID=2697469 RepID=UPI0013D7C935|nr:SusC/RagA family TonB-linked outer membrane protein [Draconibacterium mangrovi]
MKQIIYKLLILGCAAIFCFAATSSAQNQSSNISATIFNEQGNPIEGVNIFAPNGKSTVTDADGKFEIQVKDKSSIVIERDGYNSELLNISDLSDKITLKEVIFLQSAQDQIKLGIGTKNKREMVGATSTITPKNHMTYDNTQWVRDYIEGLLLGVKGSSNIRGLGNALFVIDGVIGRDPNILNMEEVDQITVLKDANAVALYGSQAKNGVIVINTKRGLANRRLANVNVRYGFKTPISLPNYLGSAEYMTLYNEARTNDGLDLQYDPVLIEEYRNSTNPYRYPNVDFYSDDYLRSMVTTADITTEFSGGNDKTQYYVNMGWNYSQSLVDINPDANAGSNRFNVRGNIDFKVNDFIKSSVDAVAILSSNKSSLSNLLSEGASFKPNAYAPLLPISMIDTASNPALAAQLNAAGIYGGMLLGGSQQFKDDTPVANVIAGGYQNRMFRSTQFNNSVDFDLDMITEGLSAKTYLSFDFYDAYRISVNNKYSVYEPTWDVDEIISLTPYGDVDQKDLTENVNTIDYVTRLGFYGLINYQKQINENHSIQSTFLGYVNSHKTNNTIQPTNNAHLGLQVSYAFKDKLFVDFSSAYVNSNKLPEGNRGGFSPTGGVAYILSEEEFIKNIDFINFLKLKATGGIVKSDLGIDNYYLYAETYSDGAWYNWADGASQNRVKDISQGANNLLGYEERVDLNLGFETYLMKSIWLEFNYFKTDMDKQLVTLNNKYPSYYNVFKPYDNYNKDTYRGFELGVDYSKTFNDFTIKLGGNLLYAQSEVVKRDEIYEYQYQYRAGNPVESIYGLVDQGFYSENDFNIGDDGKYILKDDMPAPAYGAVQPGDIKYLDKNNDGIVNDNDKENIGRWTNPWSYGLNLRLQYKGLSFFVLGTGQFGGESIMNGDYYWVDGSDKYSEVVMNRWTPETANIASYPRLSAGVNNNNYRTSTFWMYDNSFFSINRAQLTYEFGDKVCQKLRMKNLSVNVAGSNLLEVSKNSDIRQLNIGGDPQYRYFMLGLRTSF